MKTYFVVFLAPGILSEKNFIIKLVFIRNQFSWNYLFEDYFINKKKFAKINLK